MKRALKVVVGLTVLLAGLACLGGAYVYVVYPVQMAVPTLQVPKDDATLARGTYLAEHVTLCVDCHSSHDFSRFTAPIQPGSFGRGGERFGHELGFPGEIIAPNITPSALASWSDGEIALAVTGGLTPEGRALFPLMNYPGYAKLCEDDLASIVRYVRQLPAIDNQPERTELDFPVNLLVRTMPAPAATPKRCPTPADGVAYGEYLVTIASCADCHTPRKGPDPVPGMEFAGGMEFPLPGGFVAKSKNITPDLDTGIGGWTREAFISRFAHYRDPSALYEVTRGEPQTIMPWSMFAGMSDEDLGAMYDYLRTLKPVRNLVPVTRVALAH